MEEESQQIVIPDNYQQQQKQKSSSSLSSLFNMLNHDQIGAILSYMNYNEQLYLVYFLTKAPESDWKDSKYFLDILDRLIENKFKDPFGDFSLVECKYLVPEEVKEMTKYLWSLTQQAPLDTYMRFYPNGLLRFTSNEGKKETLKDIIKCISYSFECKIKETYKKLLAQRKNKVKKIQNIKEFQVGLGGSYLAELEKMKLEIDNSKKYKEKIAHNFHSIYKKYMELFISKSLENLQDPVVSEKIDNFLNGFEINITGQDMQNDDAADQFFC
jgi:hypothetical protein